MRIHRIRLVNYRCFADRTFDLADRFNLVVGDNGAGKTSLLEGLAVAIEAFTCNLPDRTQQWLDGDVARMVTHWNEGQPNVEVQPGMTVGVEGTVDRFREYWQQNLSPDGHFLCPTGSLRSLADRLTSDVGAN